MDLKTLIPPKLIPADAGKSLASFGSIAAGFLLANIAKVLLLTPNDKGNTLVEDKLLVNGAGSLISFAIGMYVKNPALKLGMFSIATFFGIRSANKIVDKLTGLGNDGAPSKIKEYMQKFLPNLTGLGEISMATPFQLPMQNYLPEASQVDRKVAKATTWD
jgi:hypothetical protein